MDRLIPADDLGAIAASLESLPANHGDGPSFSADETTARQLRAGINPDRGSESYVDRCAACHATSGFGRPPTLPAIAGNSSALTPDPTSLIRLVLSGSESPTTGTAPSALGMPAFDRRFTDTDTARLLTSVRSSWGTRPGRRCVAGREGPGGVAPRRRSTH